MKPVIQTNKHYRQLTPGTVGLASIVELVIAESVARQDANANNEVSEGAVVKAVFVEMWLTSDDATQGSIVATVEKVPSGATAMTYAQSISMYTYPNKKNVLATHQGLVAPNVQSGIPVFREWIPIPKGKQRMGLGDKIVLNISGISNGANYCGFFTYKEQL